MKIIGIVGSPHGLKGNTGKLMLEVLAAAEARGATVETVALPGNTVLPCTACHVCHEKGDCTLKDDFKTIQDKIMHSDGVVLASPHYIFSVSAQLKAFIDRCGGAIHCMLFEDKYAASVVTSGGGDEAPIAEYMNNFLLITGMRPVGAVWATMGNIQGDEFPDDIKQQAKTLGEKLVDSWEKKTTTPEVEKQRADFTERMRNLMLHRKEEWPFEYEYWRKHRRLNQ